jgi:hypothetical protein
MMKKRILGTRIAFLESFFLYLKPFGLTNRIIYYEEQIEFFNKGNLNENCDIFHERMFNSIL